MQNSNLISATKALITNKVLFAIKICATVTNNCHIIFEFQE